MLGRVELRPDYPVFTSRLRLRPLSAADTEDLVTYRSLEDVCRFVRTRIRHRDSTRASP